MQRNGQKRRVLRPLRHCDLPSLRTLAPAPLLVLVLLLSLLLTHGPAHSSIVFGLALAQVHVTSKVMSND